MIRRITGFLTFLLLVTPGFSQHFLSDKGVFLFAGEKSMGAQGAGSFIKNQGALQPQSNPGLKLDFRSLSSQPRSKPPIVGTDILNQGLGGVAGMFIGGFSGLIVGGIIGGLIVGAPHPNLWNTWLPAAENIGWLFGLMGGMLIGMPLGVWMGGNNRFVKGKLGMTFLGSLAGILVSGILSIATLGILSFTVPVLTIGGGMLGFNLSRSYPKGTEPGAFSPNTTSTASNTVPFNARFNLFSIRF